MTPLSRPRAWRNLASGSACPCVASTREAPVSSIVCSNDGQSAWSDKHESAIEAALPAHAAHTHEAGDEAVGQIAQAAHPRCPARGERREHELAGAGLARAAAR